MYLETQSKSQKSRKAVHAGIVSLWHRICCSLPDFIDFENSFLPPFSLVPIVKKTLVFLFSPHGVPGSLLKNFSSNL